MSENHIIPVSSGLFEHRERLGSAIWEFLWCIDAVTDEVIGEDGERWGRVHGGAPIKHERIAEETLTSERTVKRNMKILKDEGYIKTIRVPRGYIIKVAKNKKETIQKRSANNGLSLESDVPNVAYHNENNTKSGLSQASDVPNVALLKDFKDITTITTTSVSEIVSPIELSFGDEQQDPYLQLLNEYCKIHSKFEFHVKPKEREAMGKMVAGGMPVPFTIRTMELLLEDKRRREDERFKLPSSFLYYEDAIWEAWGNQNSSPSGTSSSSGGVSRTKTKNDKQLDALDRFIRGEEEREQGRDQ